MGLQQDVQWFIIEAVLIQGNHHWFSILIQFQANQTVDNSQHYTENI